jgi:hypothetical protein
MMRLVCKVYMWKRNKGKEVEGVSEANLQGTDTIAGCRCKSRCKRRCLVSGWYRGCDGRLVGWYEL